MKKLETKTEKKVTKTNYIEVTSLIEYLEKESQFWIKVGTDEETNPEFRKISIAKSCEVDCIIYHICEELGIKYPF